MFNQMKSAIVPIVWLNESVQIDDNTRTYLYNNVVETPRMAHIGAFAAIGLGSLFLLVLLAFISYRIIEQVSLFFHFFHH